MPTSRKIPPFYVATEDLYIHNPDSGAMPACAERAGGRVPADLVAANGWEDQVRMPTAADIAAAPAEPAEAGEE